jgi:hypothetical protein
MTVESNDDNHNILSILPFVNNFLRREFYNEDDIAKIDKDFYSSRRRELKEILMNPNVDFRIRGIYFEDFTLLRFFHSYSLQEEIGLLFHPVEYLNEQIEINFPLLIFNYLNIIFILKRLKSNLITFPIEKIYKMRNDFEMTEYERNKIFLVSLINSNYGLIDSYIYMPKGRFEIKIGDPTVASLKLDIPENQDLLVCLQMKKDSQVVFNEYNSIMTNWEVKKEQLKIIYPECFFLLFLVTQSSQKERGMSRISFNKKGKDVCLVFADEANYSYFFDNKIK